MRLRLLLLFVTVFCSNGSATIADDRIATEPHSDVPKDPAAAMVAGIDRFLLRQTEHAARNQSTFWETQDQLEKNRQFLRERLGLEPQRHPVSDGMLRDMAPAHQNEWFAVENVRWPVLSHPSPQTRQSVGLSGVGIHLRPRKKRCERLLIIVPDADERPEDWLPKELGGASGAPEWRQSVPILLASAGVDVVVLDTVSRELHQHGRAKMSRREYLHRSAFELGRTLTGYEVQMVQSLLDRFPNSSNAVCGVGEGAITALMAAAVDDRVNELALGGYVGSRSDVWKQPLSRQVFGLFERIDDGHLLAMVAPRRCVLFDDKVYSVELPGSGGAPAVWKSPGRPGREHAMSTCKHICDALGRKHSVHTGNLEGEFGPLQDLAICQDLPSSVPFPNRSPAEDSTSALAPRDLAFWETRGNRQFDSIDAYNQLLLAESEYERRDYFNIGRAQDDRSDGVNRVDTSSAAAYTESVERFREDFRQRVIGWFDEELLPPRPRSQPSLNGSTWSGHDVYLDVYPDVFAYGVLLVPHDLKPGDRRPVVVCQHGLEGVPQDTIVGDHRAYHDFAARLAERGYIVFAPQNPYRGKDEFRTLQRKAYPLGKTLFSIIGAQHQQILNWLKTVPGVDPEKIAFYGLSYGGKSAMRLPALLPEYCMSICSADFNDWVWKNASSRSPYSYVGTGEYEIFEFGLGRTFNYAEMAALIAPRPFMVERGHHDGVAPDDRVAKEFAKVRYLYQARLKMPVHHCEIEFFDGPHTIHAKGTFAFLDRHLRGRE